jgi:hypothetical protein
MQVLENVQQSAIVRLILAQVLGTAVFLQNFGQVLLEQLPLSRHGATGQ